MYQCDVCIIGSKDPKTAVGPSKQQLLRDAKKLPGAVNIMLINNKQSWKDEEWSRDGKGWVKM